MKTRPLFGLFLPFENLAFLKLLMANFGPFYFLGPGIGEGMGSKISQNQFF
jgi:hypothetical protein